MEKKRRISVRINTDLYNYVKKHAPGKNFTQKFIYVLKEWLGWQTEKSTS